MVSSALGKGELIRTHNRSGRLVVGLMAPASQTKPDTEIDAKAVSLKDISYCVHKTKLTTLTVSHSNSETIC